MGELLLVLLPVALGIAVSPLAVMALVAILLSHRARVNGLAFLVGWLVALVVVLAAFFALFGALAVHEHRDPPLWTGVLRLAIGAGFAWWAVGVYRHGFEAKQAMAAARTPRDVVAAAPQLPGWLRAVETFSPVRSAMLGFGIFALNPVDLSCGAVAALDLRLSGLPLGEVVVVAGVFVLFASIPVGVPVLASLVAHRRVQPWLDRARTWIAGNTSTLNAALLLVIAVLQIQKGLSSLL